MQIIHASQCLTPDGWASDVAIALDGNGRIASVTPGAAPQGTRVDLALPAPSNLHSHAFQRAMAGLTETRGPDPRDTFWTWRRLMYRFLDRLTPDHVEAIAALVFMEMLEAGYASVVEFHYLHHAPGGTAYANPAEMAERIIAAAQATGIGLTLLPVLYSQGGCDGRPLEGGQRRFGNTPEAYATLHAASARALAAGPADFAIGTAPHSLRAVSSEGLKAALSIAPQGPIHIHLAEQMAEVEEVRAAHGARPTDWLLANHDVTARWCAIHATQMTPRETRALARTGAIAGLCPITEANLGDGTFNAAEFTAAGGQFGVGSDSNVHIALFAELAQLEYSQRLRHRARAVLATQARSTGRMLYDNATRAGARAAGRDAGQIAPGHWADIVGISTDNAFLCARQGDTLLDSLIFSGRGQDCLTHVWSAGRAVVKDSRHIARETIGGRFKSVMAELGQDI